MAKQKDPTAEYNKRAAAALEGRTIKKARYMQAGAAINLNWVAKGLVLELDDSTFVYFDGWPAGAGTAVIVPFNGPTLTMEPIRLTDAGEVVEPTPPAPRTRSRRVEFEKAADPTPQVARAARLGLPTSKHPRNRRTR